MYSPLVKSNEKNEIVKQLVHECDGPLTPFVVIARGVDLAAANKYKADAIANAIYEVLEKFE